MGIKFKAHGKINLTLDVLARRPNGYHDVEMIMQSIGLHDTLEFEQVEDEIILNITGLPVTAGPDNLILKAARLLQEQVKPGMGAKIYLHKRIPVAAGLAGGSTDAAATLKGLTELWDLRLTQEQLLEYAAQLGADVSFCLMGGTAVARGIGEQLTALPPAPGFGVILVKPAFGVNTGEIYQGLDLDSLGRRTDTDAMIKALAKGDLNQVSSKLGNVLESVTIKLHPELLEIKNLLHRAGCRGVLMSGSGPTIFGLTETPEIADEIVDKIKLPDCQVIATSMAHFQESGVRRQ